MITRGRAIRTALDFIRIRPDRRTAEAYNLVAEFQERFHQGRLPQPGNYTLGHPILRVHDKERYAQKDCGLAGTHQDAADPIQTAQENKMGRPV